MAPEASHTMPPQPVPILALDEVVTRCTDARAGGKTIVLAHGAFDILTVAHLRSLTRAKTQGDVLVVVVENDAAVRAHTGEGHPLLPLRDRIALVAALRPVDYVLANEERTIEHIQRELEPIVHVVENGQ